MSAKMKKANSFSVTKQVKIKIQTATLGLKFDKANPNYNFVSGIAHGGWHTSNITSSSVDMSDFSQFTQIDYSNPPVPEMPLVFIASMTGIVITMYVFSSYYWNSL